MCAGQAMLGGSMSRPVTVNEQLAVLPVASVAVQVTVVTPFGKDEPLGGLHTTLTPGQLSVTVGAKVTVAAHTPGSVPVVISAGQVITGFSVSLTVTLKRQLATLPLASVAVHDTVVVPTGKIDPGCGLQTTVGLGSQLSKTTGAG